MDERSKDMRKFTLILIIVLILMTTFTIIGELQSINKVNEASVRELNDSLIIERIEELDSRISTLERQTKEKDGMIMSLKKELDSCVQKIDLMKQNFEIWNIYMDAQAASDMKRYFDEVKRGVR